ncbi:MAG: HD-GYP domain-containing protein [Solirubrobacteraceae bacterium]
MALNPNVEEQAMVADMLNREGTRMTPREIVVEALVGVGFVLACAGIWLLEPPGSFALLPALLCLAVLVIASNVRFETPFGYTVATQLAFVPMLFAVPVALAPIAAFVALATSGVVRMIAGKVPPSRLLLTVGNSWFAIGPAAVFAVAGTEPGNAGALLLVAALGAQFAVDFAISGARFWFDRGAGLVAQLRDSWVYGIDAGLSGMALIVAEDIHKFPIAALAPLPILGLLAVFARERRDRITGLLELNTAYRGTALVLGDVVEADDGYTGEHCRGVVRLALALAKEVGLDAEQTRNLEFGALLHDVGKIAVPKEIINKPGKLDAREWEIMTTHTIAGQEMLDRIGGFMRRVGLIVRSHHERWDGGGYPDGLAGERIPLEARIIACCDSWSAMRTDRSYRKALSYEVARAEIVANSGHQFDPRVAEAFLRIVERSSEREMPAPALPPPSAAPVQSAAEARAS